MVPTCSPGATVRGRGWRQQISPCAVSTLYKLICSLNILMESLIHTSVRSWFSCAWVLAITGWYMGTGWYIDIHVLTNIWVLVSVSLLAGI